MRHQVTEADTAANVGSGDVPALATPRLLAWLEAATVRSAGALVGPTQTTVGTAIRLKHVRATPVGGFVTVEATLAEPPHDHRMTFSVRAIDDEGEVVASGEIDRARVDRARFLRSLRDP